MNRLIVCLLVTLAFYSPLSRSDLLIKTTDDKGTLARLLDSKEDLAQRFLSVGSVGRTVGPGWNCTATLVAGSDNPGRDTPALILTAGHCAAGLTGDNEVVINRQSAPDWFFTPSFFYDNQEKHKAVPIVKIVYSTMKTNDIALLQLGVSYGEMLENGFKPVQLKAVGGMPNVEIAHIPVGTFPKRFMRYSYCAVHELAAVFETTHEVGPDLPWVWPRVVPNRCIGIYGGSSGAPVFVKGGNEILAVISTASDAAGCGPAQPCEIKQGQPVDNTGAAYFSAIDPLIGALKADGTFDPAGLDVGDGVILHREGVWSGPANVRDAKGELQPAQWNMHIDEAHERVRYKVGFADEIRCDDPKGYSEPLAVASQPLAALPTPQAPGIYTLCAIGKRSGDDQWQPFSQATAKLRRVE